MIRVVFAVVVLAVAASGRMSFGAEPVQIHVAPTGNDANDGSAAEPFATPAKAAAAVRALRRSGASVNVVLHAGTYRLAEPLRLTPEHSGTPEAPVIWSAKDGAKVVFSGGVPLTGWRDAELNGKKVWVTTAPEGLSDFRSLWAGDWRRPRARHPNHRGYLGVIAPPEPDAKWDVGQTQFNYKPGAVPAFTPDDAEVVHFTRWAESRLPVLRNDVALNELRFLRRTVFKVLKGDKFRIENAPEFLDLPAEWHLRRKTREVFYIPKESEQPGTFAPVIPRLSQLVLLEGKPESGQLVRNVTFRGITFAHAEWNLPRQGTHPIDATGIGRAGFVQAAYGVPGAVATVGARDCVFDRCTFKHLGSYAVELGRGSQDNRLSHCTFGDLGAGAIRIGDTETRTNVAEHARGNVVADCTIADFGRTFMGACAIFIVKAADNTITHNEIRDGYYTGISIGWDWGYAPTITRGNVVEHNHIHHLGKLSTGEGPLLSDMGAVYTLGGMPETLVRNNRFHDIDGRVYGGWGLYFDEGTSGVVAERNLIYTTTHGGFHQHYGRDNVFRNNILAFGRTRQVERSKSEDHQSFTFERNIVLWDQGVGIAGNWDSFNATFRANQYWPYGKAEPLFAYQGFEQWRQRGMDAGSVVADPGFVDAVKGDFHFKTGAGPAKELGFEPWNLEDVGPRPAN